MNLLIRGTRQKLVGAKNKDAYTATKLNWTDTI